MASPHIFIAIDSRRQPMVCLSSLRQFYVRLQWREMLHGRESAYCILYVPLCFERWYLLFDTSFDFERCDVLPPRVAFDSIFNWCLPTLTFGYCPYFRHHLISVILTRDRRGRWWVARIPSLYLGAIYYGGEHPFLKFNWFKTTRDILAIKFVPSLVTDLLIRIIYLLSWHMVVSITPILWPLLGRHWFGWH